MKKEIISFAYNHLDLAPRRDSISETLNVDWSTNVPPNSLLLRYEENVIVTDRKSIGILGEPGEAFSRLNLDLKDFSPSALGDVAVTDVGGMAYLWHPPTPPRPVWRATAPGPHFAISLGGQRLLVTRFAKDGEMQEAFAIDASDGHMLWRLSPGFHIVSATQHGLFAWTNSLDALQCFDPGTGSLFWLAAAWVGGADLYGIIDGILWGPGDHQLQRVECGAGSILPPIAVQNDSSPGGIIDDQGIFHCCRGLNYQTFDLLDDGRRLSFAEFRITSEGPTLGAGPGLWVVHPERPTQPELVWRASSMITGLVVRRGQVLIAESEGIVTAFGEEQ